MKLRYFLFLFALFASLCLCKDDKPPQDNVSPPRVQSDRAVKSNSEANKKTTAPSNPRTSVAKSDARSKPTETPATATKSKDKATKTSKATDSAAPPVNGFTRPKWATSYDIVAEPIVALNCFLPKHAKSRRCRNPACGLSPIRSPPIPPPNSTCALSIEGRVRIPDAINNELDFARIHWVMTDFGKKKCVNPSIKTYHKGKDGSRNWTFDICGTELSFDGTPANLVIKGKENGFLNQTGIVATGVQAHRVQNCCHNFKQFLEIEGYPFCWYTDYDFQVCWDENQVKENFEPAPAEF